MNWTLYNLRGPRDQVKAQIEANGQLPAAAKAFLQAQIDALPAECFAVKVDAYCQTHLVGRDVVSNTSSSVSGMK
jgi:hypothetical protein